MSQRRRIETDRRTFAPGQAERSPYFSEVFAQFGTPVAEHGPGERGGSRGPRGSFRSVVRLHRLSRLSRAPPCAAVRRRQRALTLEKFEPPKTSNVAHARSVFAPSSVDPRASGGGGTRPAGRRRATPSPCVLAARKARTRPSLRYGGATPSGPRAGSLPGTTSRRCGRIQAHPGAFGLPRSDRR